MSLADKVRLELAEGHAAEEHKLRELLWLRHGCTGLYGDDGEMQCVTCGIDFKRDSAADIEQRFQRMGLEQLANALKREAGR